MCEVTRTPKWRFSAFVLVSPFCPPFPISGVFMHNRSSVVFLSPGFWNTVEGGEGRWTRDRAAVLSAIGPLGGSQRP